MDERPAAALSFPLPFSVFPLIPSLFSHSSPFSPLSCRGSSPARGAPPGRPQHGGEDARGVAARPRKRRRGGGAARPRQRRRGGAARSRRRRCEGGCPAPAVDVRRGQMQPASAAERPDPDGRSARAARPGRGARLWAGRRRHADGGELRASAAGNGGGRPGAGSPQAAGEGLWPAPPLAHDFFSFSDQC